MNKIFILTNDVEETSIVGNRLDDATANLVFKQGLPNLLGLYEKFNVKATFYFTGTFVEKFPLSVKLVKDKDHEIGCHGYSHERYFDILSLEEQIEDLRKAKNIIENEIGPIGAFRAPALRINKFTVKALEECGFKTDSSVCPQRFDGPFTSGAVNKLNWLVAPRKPYFLSYDSPIKEGKSSVLEIPVSSFLLGYTGTTLRVSPLLNKILQYFLITETKVNNKPMVFLFHPNECLNLKDYVKIAKRSSGIKSIFSDIIRTKLKSRNLGVKAMILLERLLINIKKHGFSFVTCSDYKKMLIDEY